MDYRDNRQRWAESHQVVHFYAGQWCTFTPALTSRSVNCGAYLDHRYQSMDQECTGQHNHEPASGGYQGAKDQKDDRDEIEKFHRFNVMNCPAAPFQPFEQRLHRGQARAFVF